MFRPRRSVSQRVERSSDISQHAKVPAPVQPFARNYRWHLAGTASTGIAATAILWPWLGGQRLLVWLALQVVGACALGVVYWGPPIFLFRDRGMSLQFPVVLMNGAMVGLVGWIDTHLLDDLGFVYAVCAVNIAFAAGSVTSLMPVSRMVRASAAPALLLTCLAMVSSGNWLPAGCIATVAIVSLGEPLTIARRNVEELIDLRAAAEWAAVHDPLTGLANRTMLEQPNESWRTVLYIDLDGFKEINDAHGHQAGDAVLVEVADRLRSNLAGHTNRVVRMGGDEFVILTDTEEHRHTDSLAATIHASLMEPFASGVTLGVSIGAACLGPDEQLERGLERADSALYQAKRQGGRRTIQDADR